ASAPTASRATSASLSRGASGGDGIGSLVLPLSPAVRAQRDALSHPHSAALRHLGQAAGRVAGLHSSIRDSHARHDVGAGVGHA
ncbi:MAG: hypothetical protein ACRDQ2_04600, partial [Gaiellales bacterium]